MLGFIKTTEGVYTFECIPVDKENLVTYYWRVAIENKLGFMVRSKWRPGSMSPEGTARNAARKMKGTLHLIQMSDAEIKEMERNAIREINL